MLNVLSIDLEEYFHPTEVQNEVDASRWSSLTPRVEYATQLVLELLDRHNAKATFFVLGWVASRYPKLVRDIARRGHEIGCHSYRHELVYALTPQEFRADTEEAVRAIEDACGVTPVSYRAPSYSITNRSLWALEILAECGFTRDSSIYPIAHDRYGIPGFGRHAQVLSTPSGPILEVPIATVQLSAGRVAPVGGGAYLRLFPYRYTAAGIRQINTVDRQPACIYLHPWELDPELPRLAAGFISRLRTYSGLSSVGAKMERLVTEFQFSSLADVYPLHAGRSTVTAQACA